VTVGLLSLN